jgi:hypothetical protein
MQQRDYIERLIQQIAIFVARILGAAQKANVPEAEEALDSAWRALGLLRKDAMRLDDATLKMLLGAKASLGADLFDAQAALEEARSDTPVADELRARAILLRE